MKRSIKLLSLVLIIIVASALLYLVQQKRVMPIPIRQCPDKWLQNRMPRTAPTTYDRILVRLGLARDWPSDYFVIAGKRRELREFDVDWIKASCSVKPSKVW